MKQRLLGDVDAELGELRLAARARRSSNRSARATTLMFFVCDLAPCGHVLGVVAGRGIDDLGGRAQGIEHRAGAAAAAADQADPDLQVRPHAAWAIGARPPRRPPARARSA